MCLLECCSRDKKLGIAEKRGYKLKFIHWEGKNIVGPESMWIDVL